MTAQAAADQANWRAYVHSLAVGTTPSAEQLAGLCSSGRLDVLASIAYEQFEGKLQGQLIRPFWQQLRSARDGGSSDSEHGLLQPLQTLAHAVEQQSQQLSALAQQLLLGLLQQQQQQQDVGASTVALLSSMCERHRMAVTSLIMATAPFSLPDLLQQYYHTKLQELCEVVQQLQEQEAQDSDDAMGSEDAMTSPTDQQQQQQAARASQHSQQQQQQQQRDPDPLPVLGESWTQELVGVARCLEQLGLGTASEEAYTRVINSYVLERLRGLATQEFDQAVLPRAQPLVCAGPLAFLGLVLQAAGDTGEAKLQEWRLRLTYLMLETLGALRSSDMFDIVIDYPDSAPALEDLAACLQHTSLAGHFAASFRAALQQRLLHAGAATGDIIHTYVSTIRAMQQVDQSGLLLELVSEPIRAYLRSRPDTIRCIVSMLTEDPSDSGAAAGGGLGGSLLEELQQQQQQQQQSLSSQQAAGQGPLRGGGGLGAFAAAAGAAAAVAAATAGGGGGVSSGAAAAASAAAHASYNWCVGEAEGDDAALRLLEALEAGPTAAAAVPAGGSSEGTPAAAGGGAAAAGSAQATGPGSSTTTTLLGLPISAAAPASAALAGSSLASRGEGDVVSMLIGIYGGPLLFMEEYRRMLADRLLAKEEYDCVREIRTLELLKIRFGDAGLHACEVLLKDMADSKRLDANIRALRPASTAQPLPPGVEAALSRCHATVASYLFWPELPEHELKLPAELQTALEVYAERFRHLKAPRKLHWRPTLGLVELRLTVGGGAPLDFKVTPVHAALLMQFADDDAAGTAAAAAGGGSSQAMVAAGAGGMDLDHHHQQQQQAQSQQQQSQPSSASAGGAVSRTASQLSAALGVPSAVVRRKAMFWVAAGVLLERRGAKGEVVYTRATRLDPSRIGSREVSDYSWKESPGGAASAEDRLVAEMGPFENYILGMLTNFGALPCERLHNMLRVFVVGEPKYEGRTQEQLGAFLQLLVEQGKLEASNGIYSKHKGPPA